MAGWATNLPTFFCVVVSISTPAKPAQVEFLLLAVGYIPALTADPMMQERWKGKEQAKKYRK